MNDPTLYAWKKPYAHLGVSELWCFRQLEENNCRLKQLVADLSLDTHRRSEALRKKVYGPLATWSSPNGFSTLRRGPAGTPRCVDIGREDPNLAHERCPPPYFDRVEVEVIYVSLFDDFTSARLFLRGSVRPFQKFLFPLAVAFPD